MGGFGGALKQLSIGFASQKGKTWIHTAGQYTEWRHAMKDSASQEKFTAAMADAASSVVNYFRSKGQIAFITVMANISLSCDCAGASAPAPRIRDIGILASTDPVAIDRAALDLLKKNVDTGTDDLFSQINRLKGENTINIAAKLGLGSLEYNLINVDEDQDVDQTQKQEMEQTQKQEIEQTQKQEIEQTQKQEMEQTQKQEMEQTQKQEIEQTQQQEIEQTQKQEIEQTQKQEIKQTQKQEMEQTQKQEMEQTQKQEIEQSQKQEMEEDVDGKDNNFTYFRNGGTNIINNLNLFLIILLFLF